MAWEHDESGTSRRDAIKKAVAAGTAAGLVWSAPKIQGLSLRPNYAAAASTITNWTVQLNALGEFVNVPSLSASTAINDAVAFANSSPVVVNQGVLFGVNARGTGLGTAHFTIDAVNSPGGSVPFTPNPGIMTAFVISTRVNADPAFDVTYPVTVSGRFSCA